MQGVKHKESKTKAAISFLHFLLSTVCGFMGREIKISKVNWSQKLLLYTYYILICYIYYHKIIETLTLLSQVYPLAFS